VSSNKTNECPICGDEYPTALGSCPWCVVQKSKLKESDDEY
jgi:hypothetical protein